MVIAIIGVLVALLLPAIQAAREAARRVQCVNHLKQIGLACNNVESTRGHLPSGGWNFFWSADPSRGYGKDQPGSWIFNILDQIEGGNTRALGSGLDPVTDRRGYKTATTQLASTPNSVFNCPSRRPAVTYIGQWNAIYVQTWLTSMARAEGYAKSDYAANAGNAITTDASVPGNAKLFIPSSYAEADSDTAPWSNTSVCEKTGDRRLDSNVPRCQNGVIYYRSEVQMRQIEDGTSNTYLVGEKWMPSDGYDGNNNQNTPGFSYGDNQSMYVGFDWDTHRAAWNPDENPNSEFSQPSQDRAGFGAVLPERRFGSAHSGGFNMVFVDGSVRTIGYEIDPLIHIALAVRFDGESVDSNSY